MPADSYPLVTASLALELSPTHAVFPAASTIFHSCQSARLLEVLPPKKEVRVPCWSSYTYVSGDPETYSTYPAVPFLPLNVSALAAVRLNSR